jgi:CheY-like chemotaxis protein
MCYSVERGIYAISLLAIGSHLGKKEAWRPMTSHVLVIDDDPSLLELYQLLLEAEGYRVTTSKTAYEHVSDVENLQPDLILMDMKLGSKENGFLLLQKLRLYRPTKDIPIIICTAAVQAVREQEETFKEKGIPIIYKPFEIDELLQVVRQYLPTSIH